MLMNILMSCPIFLNQHLWSVCVATYKAAESWNCGQSEGDFATRGEHKRGHIRGRIFRMMYKDLEKIEVEEEIGSFFGLDCETSD